MSENCDLVLAHSLFQLNNEVGCTCEKDAFPRHTGRNSKSCGIVGLPSSGRAYEDNVFLFFYELKGFKLFEFWQKNLIIFCSVKITKILFDWEFCVAYTAVLPVFSASKAFTFQ